MFEILDRRASLTGNQIKILAAAIIGDALEFFDYFLIGFVLAFLIGPWKLTFGQSAIVLMSSGVGAIIGAYAWGWLADRIGRRKVFIGTVLNFSIATGLLYFTPDDGWIYLSLMRFFVGVGVGGLYCVDLPLVQEFMPSSKRGWVGGIVTCVIPLGVGLGAAMGAGERPAVDARGLGQLARLPVRTLDRPGHDMLETAEDRPPLPRRLVGTEAVGLVDLGPAPAALLAAHG